MTKAELTTKVADECELTKKQAGDAVDAVFGAMRSEILIEGKFAIPGFGNFTVKDRAARKGRNPQTGKEIEIKARKVLAFKPSSVISTDLNG